MASFKTSVETAFKLILTESCVLLNFFSFTDLQTFRTFLLSNGINLWEKRTTLP